MSIQPTDNLVIERAGVHYKAPVSALPGSGSVVSSRIRRAVDQSIPVGAGWTDIVWDTVSHEQGGDVWTSGATLTIPETGIYTIAAEATYSQTGVIGTVVAMMRCMVNGASVGDMESQVVLAAKPTLWIYAERPFNAGDTVVVQTTHDNASALSILAQGTHSPDIILSKVGGAKGDPGSGGGATYGGAILDFGPFPGSNEASVSFAFAGVGTDVTAHIASNASTVDYTAEDHKYAAMFITLSAEPNPGVGGVIYARSQFELQGTYAVRWAA